MHKAAKYNRRIIFRADGNSRIGLGHVVRSLALAHMLHDDFECVFAIQEPDEALKAQILETCHGIITLPVCVSSEERFDFELSAYISDEEIVVLDGYTFNCIYQQTIKTRGAQLVCIDDIHSYFFVADVVINQAGGVDPEKYKTAPYTRLLLGPQFALLRPAFLKAAKLQRVKPEGEPKLLLNLGGADPENYTLKLAQEIAVKSNSTTIEIVIGSAYKHQPELESWLQSQTNVNLHKNLSAEQMCELMQHCAVAVTSASGVAYEYASVGGLLFVLQTAENQTGLYSFLLDNAIAKPYTPDSLVTDLTAFDKQVTIQRQFFDGQSNARLRDVFKQIDLSTSLKLRKATIDDLQMVYDWNNDPEVRLRSFNPEPILLENHTRWFTAKLEDTTCKFYIAEASGIPAAQIRFDVKGETATISYLISKEFRGKGLGHTVLLKGINKLQQEAPELKVIEGLVQQDNIASLRAFEKSGFTYGKPDPAHPGAYRFTIALPHKV